MIQERDLIVNVIKYNYTIEHVFAIAPECSGPSMEKRNMILFMSGQLRYDTVGIFGNEVSQLCWNFLIVY
jgi:hypothetical protein